MKIEVLLLYFWLEFRWFIAVIKDSPIIALNPLSTMLLLAIFILTIPIEVLGMLLRSSAVQLPTAKGMQTVHETIKRINRPPHVVINTVLDFNSWSKWISPGSQFISDIPKFSKVGQSCREVFGLFGSSYITWTVVHLSSSEVRLVSSGSQGTFGWEDLTLEFSVEEDNTLSPNGPTRRPSP